VAREHEKEDGNLKSQKILLTWLIESESIFRQIKKYISPEDFTQELYRTVANLLLTPIAILTTLSAPMTSLALAADFSPLASFFTLIYTEWLIVLPYESFPTLIWFGFGCVTTQQFFKVSICRLLLFFIFFLVVILPWWGVIGLV